MQHLEIVPSFVAQLDGKVLPNAHAVVDVDGDDIHDLVFGSMNGTVAVFKMSLTRLTKWKECRVNGCVTAICADSTLPNDMRIFVATADGVCFVIQATESGDDFQPSADFRVALNVCDVTLHRGFLVFGTREGAILVYIHDKNAFGDHRHLQTFELGAEVESFLSLASDPSSPQLLVRCVTGEIFEIQLAEKDGEVSASHWDAPSRALHDGSLPYLVDGVRLPGSDEDGVACGSLAGQIEVLSQSGDRVWQHEISEAVVGMDRVRINADADAIIACTWSGVFYAIRDPEHIAHFRMMLPAASMFCADVQMGNADSDTTRVLVAISTSGVISIYLGLHDVLGKTLNSPPLLEAVKKSPHYERIDTEEKRRAILKKLLEKTDQSEVSELSVLLSKKSIAVEDFIRLATTQRW